MEAYYVEKGSVALYGRFLYGDKPLHYKKVKTMDPKVPKKIRLDLSLYCRPGWIYSITIVSNFKRQYFLKHKLNICLMPKHLHFLTTPVTLKNSVIDFVNHFKGKSTTIA